MRTKRPRSEHDNNSSIKLRAGEQEQQGLSDINRVSQRPSAITTHDLNQLLIQKPLSNPGDQIRLLRLSEDPVEQPESLRFTVVVQDLCSSSEFIAISYTWGDENYLQHIFIDGKKCAVRRNCHEALLQTCEKRGEARCDLIWIDSICINQQDDLEKSFQVSIMGNIYARATHVFACLGSHANESEFVFENARETAAFSLCDHDESMCPNCRLPWEIWTLALGIHNLRRLCNACAIFGGRSYWSRVWIIQEIAKAENLWILCGTDLLPWKALNNLEHFLGLDMEDIKGLMAEYERLPCCVSNMMHDVFISRRDTIHMEHVFSLYSESGCFDPRDHLYGLISLIEWPSSMEPIFPDYRRSSFDLALQVQAHIPFQLIPTMLTAFKVTANDKSIQGLLRRRRDSAHVRNKNISAQKEEEFRPLHEENRTTVCAWIFEDEHKNMSAPLVKKNGWSKGTFRSQRQRSASASTVSSTDTPHSIDSKTSDDPDNSDGPDESGYPDESYDPDESVDSDDSDYSEDSDDSEYSAELANRAVSYLSSVSMEAGANMVMLGGQVAGFVCNQAVAGDVLMPVQSETEEIFLVLRLIHGKIFEIIGQGILLPEYVFGFPTGSSDKDTSANLFTAHVEINMDDDDTVLLFAQDMDDMDEMEDSFRQECRWRRVLTRATGTRAGFVRLSEQSQMRVGDVAPTPDSIQEMSPESLIRFITNARQNSMGKFNDSYAAGLSTDSSFTESRLVNLPLGEWFRDKIDRPIAEEQR